MEFYCASCGEHIFLQKIVIFAILWYFNPKRGFFVVKTTLRRSPEANFFFIVRLCRTDPYILMRHGGSWREYEKKIFEISKHEFFQSIFGNWSQKNFEKKKFLRAFQPIWKKEKKISKIFFKIFQKKKFSKFFFHFLKLAELPAKKFSKFFLATKF